MKKRMVKIANMLTLVDLNMCIYLSVYIVYVYIVIHIHIHLCLFLHVKSVDYEEKNGEDSQYVNTCRRCYKHMSGRNDQ
jgi:heme/copper-type cytochrome/quinol oxidase subunit 4